MGQTKMIPSKQRKISGKKLTDTIETEKQRVILLGDFNSRFEKGRTKTTDVLGFYGEDHKNNNG